MLLFFSNFQTRLDFIPIQQLLCKNLGDFTEKMDRIIKKITVGEEGNQGPASLSKKKMVSQTA